VSVAKRSMRRRGPVAVIEAQRRPSASELWGDGHLARGQGHVGTGASPVAAAGGIPARASTTSIRRPWRYGTAIVSMATVSGPSRRITSTPRSSTAWHCRRLFLMPRRPAGPAGSHSRRGGHRAHVAGVALHEGYAARLRTSCAREANRPAPLWRGAAHRRARAHPLRSAFTWLALDRRRSAWVALAAISCAAVVSTNFYGATGGWRRSTPSWSGASDHRRLQTSAHARHPHPLCLAYWSHSVLAHASTCGSRPTHCSTFPSTEPDHVVPCGGHRVATASCTSPASWRIRRGAGWAGYSHRRVVLFFSARRAGPSPTSSMWPVCPTASSRSSIWHCLGACC